MTRPKANLADRLVSAALGPFWRHLSLRGVAPIQMLNEPIPVECRAEVPARPAVPTEALVPRVDLDRFAAAAVAEIEMREGYEGELRVALAICTAPLSSSSKKRRTSASKVSVV